MKKTRLLLVDDDTNIQFAFKKAFEREKYIVSCVNNGEEALKIIEREIPDLIFMDISMPIMDGLTTLSEMNNRGIVVPVIIITGYGTMKTAIKATQLGAYEYILKPLDIDKVYLVAKRALEMVALRKELIGLKLVNSSQSSKNEIIGVDKSMQDVFKTIGAISNTPNTNNVLITGESGTGKELVARAIHEHGGNNNQPFIAINCTALTDSLLESELFGHEKGSFTDAIDKKIGKFEMAGFGTIFLDEIGDISPSAQKTLLRVLQEREFERVGGTKTIKVNARFIAATNKNLEREIDLGNFRQDLFYRINVMQIELPPLRERGEDVILLLEHFVQKYSQKYSKNINAISSRVEEYVRTYNFPGNVRELENLVGRAIALINGEVLDFNSLKIPIPKSNKTQNTSSTLVFEEAKKLNLEKFEQKYLIDLLKASEDNITKAAQIAKVDRKTIQRLLKKHGFYSE